MRLLILLIVICGALIGASYAGGRLAAGSVTGSNAPGMGPMTTHFAFEGIPNLPDHPRGWIFAYPAAKDLSPGGAEIYVNVMGHLLGTRPADLADKIAARKATEP